MKKQSKSNPKIQLRTIVESVTTQNIGGRQIPTGNRFVAALTKLAQDPMPIGERYAAGRTLNEVNAWLREYQSKATSLMATYGKKVSVILADERAKLAAVIEETKKNGTQNSGTALQEKQLAAYDKQLADIQTGRQQDSYQMPVGDVEGIKQLNAEIDKVLDTFIPLEYLNHRITLSPDSKLDGTEIVLLQDIVEMPDAGS